MFRAAVVAVLTLAVAAMVTAAAGRYVGASKCKMCHNTEAKGAQYTHWADGPHAKAYATLAGDEAKQIATGMGIEDPQASEACLRCHVTAYTADASMKAESWTMEEGVGCESCHGPGENYKTMAVMKDKAQSIEMGLIEPTVEVCVGCHNEQSPTFKPFDYEARVALIAHPNPQRGQ